MSTLDRRAWLKRGALTAAGALVMPHLSFGETPRAQLKFDNRGRICYSPFFKEYNAAVFPDETKLVAKLNANENPYGPSAKAIEAFKEKAHMGNRYAWKELFDLMDKIAVLEKVNAKNIMMGPGSSDLLEKTAMVMFAERRECDFRRPFLYVFDPCGRGYGGFLETRSAEKGLVPRPQGYGSGHRL